MPKAFLAAVLVTSLLVPASVYAAETSIQINLATASDFERHVMVYDCDSGDPITVSYINAVPNFLALVPVPEQSEPLLFVSVIAASGARYAAGQFVWWTKGADASLYDITLGEAAAPVLTCSEVNNTP